MLAADGPTPKALTGFYPIEAASLHEAVRIVSNLPAARKGAVESRPVIELDR